MPRARATSRSSGASPRPFGSAARPASARAATARRSPGCTTRARWSPAARSGRSEAVLRGTSSMPSTRAAGSTTRWPARASGFCIYNDPALAIARARRDGPAGAVRRPRRPPWRRRPGDPLGRPGGAHGLVPRDRAVPLPGHRRGRRELGGRSAAGTAVNVPLEPGTGRGRLAGARSGAVCRSWRRRSAHDLVVSSTAATAIAWDPLAHLRLTTDCVWARRPASWTRWRTAGPSGRWLATGGGGYDAYRVVPRAWALVWLARRASGSARRDCRRRGASAGRPRRRATGRRPCPRGSRTRRSGLAMPAAAAGVAAREPRRRPPSSCPRLLARPVTRLGDPGPWPRRRWPGARAGAGPRLRAALPPAAATTERGGPPAAADPERRTTAAALPPVAMIALDPAAVTVAVAAGRGVHPASPGRAARLPIGGRASARTSGWHRRGPSSGPHPWIAEPSRLPPTTSRRPVARSTPIGRYDAVSRLTR